MILYQNVPVTTELFRIPSIIDEFTRDCLRIKVSRNISLTCPPKTGPVIMLVKQGKKGNMLIMRRTLTETKQ